MIDSTAKHKLKLRLIWLFGLTGFELLPRFTKKAKRRPSNQLTIRKFLAILGIKGLVNRLRYLLKDIAAKIKIKEMMVKLRFGVDEPALSGFMFGLISAIKPFLRLTAQHQLDIGPSFTSQHFFEGYAYCNVTILPLKMIFPLCRFTLSPQGLRMVRVILFKSS